MNLDTTLQTILVVGRESVGKSQLISALTGRPAGESNFRGSTVAVSRYVDGETVYIDTPGILRRSDTETTRRALQALDEHETVILVAQATQLDDDLREMLPLVHGLRGIIVVTFWDKVQPGEAAQEALERLSADCGVPLIPVNARRLNELDRERLIAALREPAVFAKPALRVQAGWRIEPRPGLLEHPIAGPFIATLLLVIPALATILGANRLAELLHPQVAAVIEPVAAAIEMHASHLVRVVLIGRREDFGYGLLNMGPFLLVWALPTVLLFAVILGAYKASGLVERMNVALHPLVRPLGLSGRDVVRVVMGFGCNVPAVISTRACSGCSRNQAVSAIAFGAACSYQLPATLAVLSATAASTGRSAFVLSLAFLGYLLLSTLIYLAATASRQARSPLNVLLAPRRPFMQWPTPSALYREASGTVRQFCLQALPVFAGICIVASLLAESGVLDTISRILGPWMMVFDLPAQAALPVVLASIRKDGIFLLAAEQSPASLLAPSQALTAVYLAGVLFPCLVTALTIAREIGWKVTGSLLAKQAAFAIAFSLLLAWGGRWLLPR